MTVSNLSFAASGFLGIYHVGAAEAFLRHGDKLLVSLRACAGASAGAMVAAVMVTAPDKLQMTKQFVNELAESVRHRKLGMVVPGPNLMLTLRQLMEVVLPIDAHHLATDRLHVSITNLKSGKNHLVSRFTSRDELIMALLASSYVPVYAGLKPVEFIGEKWIDGGFTDSLPVLPVGRTITVSPFAGIQDVCPLHSGQFNTHLRLANMSMMLSVDNLKRLHQALFPPPPSVMRLLCEEGFRDTVRFLKREAWMS
ncbi:patatin-like phospholipase domain-containing protein 4 isoform X1 [Takifugu rubripes]|nr:patatin-like phospholipase domain-containing protein 4 isoform X1 [Takifugu rubripes]XP_029688363.1 patatin-like phospholipase domain-containing protein 4 isoform X1 [Takifugu rubripes]|eukprot:XP_003977633.1 PREDICTED: patatin-like phospholipase domain-containing protein 4 isoform X1 [Takifugu rubripes]